MAKEKDNTPARPDGTSFVNKEAPVKPDAPEPANSHVHPAPPKPPAVKPKAHPRGKDGKRGVDGRQYR